MASSAKDLEVLRKEYRNMEMNRKSFAEESNSVGIVACCLSHLCVVLTHIDCIARMRYLNHRSFI